MDYNNYGDKCPSRANHRSGVYCVDCNNINPPVPLPQLGNAVQSLFEPVALNSETIVAQLLPVNMQNANPKRAREEEDVNKNSRLKSNTEPEKDSTSGNKFELDENQKKDALGKLDQLYKNYNLKIRETTQNEFIKEVNKKLNEGSVGDVSKVIDENLLNQKRAVINTLRRLTSKNYPDLKDALEFSVNKQDEETLQTMVTLNRPGKLITSKLIISEVGNRRLTALTFLNIYHSKPDGLSDEDIVYLFNKGVATKDCLAEVFAKWNDENNMNISKNILSLLQGVNVITGFRSIWAIVNDWGIIKHTKLLNCIYYYLKDRNMSFDEAVLATENHKNHSYTKEEVQRLVDADSKIYITNRHVAATPSAAKRAAVDRLIVDYAKKTVTQSGAFVGNWDQYCEKIAELLTNNYPKAKAIEQNHEEKHIAGLVTGDNFTCSYLHKSNLCNVYAESIAACEIIDLTGLDVKFVNSRIVHAMPQKL